MASKTQKIRAIRARKHKSQKANVKAERKRVQKTFEVISKLMKEAR